MKPKPIILLMGTLGSLLALVFLTIILQPGFASATSTTRYVAPGGNCGGASPCYASVQAAVDAAHHGDEIKIAQGTYTDIHARGGITQVVYINKTVTLRGGYATWDWNTSDPAAYPTTLDAQGRGRVLYLIGSDIHPTIEGLRITGGDATGLGGGTLGGNDAGGGVYISEAEATISNSIIISNAARTVRINFAAGEGGGIYLDGGKAILLNNTIQANHGNTVWDGNGGGLYAPNCRHVMLKGNMVRGNVAASTNGVGGGLFIASCDSASLVNNVIRDNKTSTGADARGGGLYMLDSDHVRLIGNTIENNIASQNTWGYGGGIYLVGGNDVILLNNIVAGNMATGNPLSSGWGGGLYLAWSDATLINMVIADNLGPTLGSGIYAAGSSLRILHTTIARNKGAGGGLGVDTSPWGATTYSRVAMTNTIIVSHTVGITVTAGNAATLNATLWHGNGADRGGAGTINHAHDHRGDPKFAADGYHLTANSAAIDQGVNAGVLVDIDGQMRPVGQGYDLGADEFGAHPLRRLYLPMAWRTH